MIIYHPLLKFGYLTKYQKDGMYYDVCIKELANENKTETLDIKHNDSHCIVRTNGYIHVFYTLFEMLNMLEYRLRSRSVVMYKTAMYETN